MLKLLIYIAYLATLIGVSPASAEPFKFVAMGDMPYGKASKVEKPYKALIKVINKRNPDFTIHVGDIKSGNSKCSNKNLLRQLNNFNTFKAALIYTPGDNEWTDCGRKKAGRFDTNERLSFLRENFFANPIQSLGQKPTALEPQSIVQKKQFARYVENSRFIHKDVLFAQIHVVGSNNNYGKNEKKPRKEFIGRNKANIAWLKAAFKKATQAKTKAIVISLHADMFKFGMSDLLNTMGISKNSGFQEFLSHFEAQIIKFNRPALLVYGDSHIHKIWKPFPDAPQFTALEVYGKDDMHAIEVSVNPDSSRPFSFEKITNPLQQ